MRKIIKIQLNDDDPQDAAILAALNDCLPKRRAARARALLAAGLGVIKGQEAKRSDIHIVKGSRPSENPPQKQESDPAEALARATDNFLNAFG
jgi:hypothetical protein